MVWDKKVQKYWVVFRGLVTIGGNGVDISRKAAVGGRLFLARESEEEARRRWVSLSGKA